jgi:type IV pilus assembly protein PilA
MTDFSDTPTSTQKTGIPVWVWALMGCGCLPLVLIVLILAAIALPAFLNQANKARESEAKTYVGSMVRGQQAYFLEKGQFTASLPDLGLGIAPESESYRYTISPPQGNRVVITAVPKKPNLKSVAGAVFAIGQKLDATTVGQVCLSDSPSMQAPIQITAPASVDARPQCPAGSSSVMK